MYRRLCPSMILSLFIAGSAAVAPLPRGAPDEYAIRAAGTASNATIFEAHNRAHGLLATFDAAGVRVQSSQRGAWRWVLRLERFGYRGNLAAVDSVSPVAGGSRVEYRRGALTEWYVNDRRGLEQGFTVREPPATGQARTAPLLLELRAKGLEAHQEVAARSIVLRGDNGDGVLRYRGLVVQDTTGATLPAELWAVEGGVRIEVDDRGAIYPVTVDPYIESAILHASDAQSIDFFGGSAAISLDTAIIGAAAEDGGPGDPLDGAGAAYIFARNQGGVSTWAQIRKLTASDAEERDSFGSDVAIAGNAAIVGARSEDGGPGGPLPEAGAAYIFERNQGGAGNWGEVRKLIASDVQAFDRFGWSVAIAGDTAIVGARSEEGGPGNPLPAAGAAYVFERNQGGVGNWGEVAKLTASDAQEFDFFGDSVAIAGDTAIVGAPGEDGGPGDPLVNAGAAYIFERNQGGAGSWGQVKRVGASDAQEGDILGDSVAIFGDLAIAGAPAEDGGAGDPLVSAGAAYIFGRDQGGAGNWGEIRRISASNVQASAFLGGDVDIAGDTAVVGADGFRNPPPVGAAYVFERNRGGADNWGEVQKLVADDTQEFDEFGSAVSISGDTVLVGAAGEGGGEGNPFSGAGAAYVFELDPGVTWAFVLDAFGGLHALGPGVVPIKPAPPYLFFDIARDLELWGDGAYVLDGFGGLHVAGGVPRLTPAPPYFGFDIARDLELITDGAGYILDGYGGVHTAGGAPPLEPPTPYFGFDAARDLELGGGGYYVLDGFGGLHAGAGAMVMSPGPPYFGFDIARDLELAAGGGGYVLDGFGGVHRFGGAPAMAPATPYFGFDVACDLELAPGGGYYVLDGFGGLHAGGGAAPITPAPPYFGFDVVRALEIAR